MQDSSVMPVKAAPIINGSPIMLGMKRSRIESGMATHAPDPISPGDGALLKNWWVSGILSSIEVSSRQYF